MLVKPSYEELEARVQALGRSESELKKAKAALRESEDRYRLMFDNAPIGYQSLDKNGCIIDVNKVWLDSLGYQRDEVLGSWFGEFLHHDQKDIFRRLFPVNIQSREPIYGVEFTLKRKDGTFIIAEYNARIGRDAEGRFVRTHCVFQDITKRKQAENKLRDSEAQMKAILDASIDSIRLVDKDMRIIWTNKIIETQLKKERKNIVGDYCYHAYTGRSGPCPNCPTEKALKSGETEHSIIIEENVKGIEGKSYWADYAVPIKNESGEIVNFIQVSRDITVIKKAEIALLEEKIKLENALAEVKKLSGMLPICSICKNIRDDKGYWNRIEAYIEDHSGVDFSHSLCPTCAKKHYPDLDIYSDKDD
jgi:PAS domain S-box-containing protein